MGIYSTNRSGYASLDCVPCNENYTDADFGRIMYESECNDKALFEAIIYNDLREINGIREGTILLDEAIGINKDAIKDFFVKMKQRVMAFWAKIKAAFQAVVRKIAAYVLRDGKAFVKDFNVTWDKFKKKGKTWSGDIEAKLFGSNKNELDDIISLLKALPSMAETAMRGLERDSDILKKADVIKTICSEFGGVTTVSELKAKAKEEVGTVKITNESQVKDMLNLIENGSKWIKQIKTTENSVKKSVSTIGGKLKDAERDAENDNSVIKNIGVLVSVWETLTSAFSSIAISEVRSDVKESRRVLGEVKRDMAKAIGSKEGDKAVAEAAAIVDADEVDNALGDIPEVDADDPEIAAEVEEVIADAE